MTYYLFHHPLESKNGIPGRHRFSVRANLVSRDQHLGRRVVDVAIDSFGADQPGANVDPCPFADPYALAHTFCGIDRRAGRYLVPGAGLLLSEVLTTGDTVIYGHLRTRKGEPVSLWVDTVMVVSRIIDLPLGAQLPGPGRWPHALNDAYAKAILQKPTASFASLKATRIWEFNLRDAEPGRRHHYSGINPHKAILADAERPNPDALRARNASFVPLLASDRQSLVQLTAQREPVLWRKLAALVNTVPRLRGSMKPPVRLQPPLGKAIYDAAIRWSGHGSAQSGFVAIPPLQWPP